MDAERLYAILRLRSEVFVVEQACAYQDVDGLDAGQCRHFWIDDVKGIACYLRLMDDGGVRRIGRVVTRPDARGQGLARKLLAYALVRSEGPWELSAQTYLRAWYSSLGFAETGPDFLEDGIPHVPMRREAREEAREAWDEARPRRQRRR